MRKESDYCTRCGSPIETDMIGKTDICGSCADDLRMDEDARAAQAIGEAEQEAYDKYKWEEQSQ